jgi:DNA-binding transcriptional MerR regulator/effector-binding domain-containing protein
VFAIGEFSRITGLSVKALRFYHEEGLLVPSCVDDESGYRYYDERKVEPARVIAHLRKLEFSVAEIKELLGDDLDDARVLDLVERKRNQIEERIRSLRATVVSLDQFLAQEREAARAMAIDSFEVREKSLPPMLIASIRVKGRYCESGPCFARIARQFGRHVNGKCFLLHYDSEFHDAEADFEACMPIARGESADGISVRQLPGVTCVTLLHKGPYDQLGRSYAKALAHVREKSCRVLVPTREVYLKGPGMIFKGNPKNYLTEIQMPVEPAPA